MAGGGGTGSDSLAAGSCARGVGVGVVWAMARPATSVVAAARTAALARAGTFILETAPGAGADRRLARVGRILVADALRLAESQTCDALCKFRGLRRLQRSDTQTPHGLAVGAGIADLGAVDSGGPQAAQRAVGVVAGGEAGDLEDDVVATDGHRGRCRWNGRRRGTGHGNGLGELAGLAGERGRL